MITDWVVMFVDMKGSTEFKYGHDEKVVQHAITRLYASIDAETPCKQSIKFTGDGAMVIYRVLPNRQAYTEALNNATRIVQRIDWDNFNFETVETHDPCFEIPPIRIRIGIASGPCLQFGNQQDVIGKPVDLAARLCAEANLDRILVDQNTTERSSLPSHRYKRCVRRLLLKGIPIPSTKEPEQFFELEVDRLLREPTTDLFSKGLVALFPDRKELRRDMSLSRLLDLTARGSNILVAGRTLIAWTKIIKEMLCVAKEKGITFHFLYNSEQSLHYLDSQQLADSQLDLPVARQAFNNLQQCDVDHFHVRETDHLILDGVTCARICLPRTVESNEAQVDWGNKLIVQQDINDAAGDAKATVLWVCTCNSAEETGKPSCTAHGLYHRTRVVYDYDETQRRKS